MMNRRHDRNGDTQSEDKYEDCLGCKLVSENKTAEKNACVLLLSKNLLWHFNF